MRTHMGHTPIAAIALTLRCHHRESPADVSVCGAPAFWSRPGAQGFPPCTYCDLHRGPMDRQMAPAPLVRRVRVTLVADLAGAALLPAAAHSEAVNTLVSALESVGAVVSLVDVGSTVAQNPA